MSLPAPPEQPASVWRSPLLPVALAVTVGIAADRAWMLPLAQTLPGAIAFLIAWFLARRDNRPRIALGCLLLVFVGVGAAYHHDHCFTHSANDVGAIASTEPRAVRVRGSVDEEPTRLPATSLEPLRSRPREASCALILSVNAIWNDGNWQPLSGRVRLLTPGNLAEVHSGDELEVTGLLSRFERAVNPGGFDREAYWRDHRVRAQLVIRQTAAGVIVHRAGWFGWLSGWTGHLRAWGQRALSDALPERTRGIACALLLGEGAPMTRSDWDRYARTGVIHVLAISGQHLVLLAMALGLAFRLLGFRQRRVAILIAALLVGYALVTGGRPPALRAAVSAACACGALLLRRPTQRANLLALSWLVVAAVNPTDIFDPGCQLSFLSVAVLIWGADRLLERSTDPLDVHVAKLRPAWERFVRWCAREMLLAVALSLLVWLAVSPLVAYHMHMVTPIAVILGPPVSLLATLALFAGFVVLILSAIHPALAAPFGILVHLPLLGCEGLVDLADRLGTHQEVSAVPLWWVAIFHVGLLAALTQRPLRARRGWCVVVGLGWLCIGLIVALIPAPVEGLRVTFLAVGHGGCTVMETSKGRVILYDAGTMTGPEVARQHILPYLRYRGIRRIDEVFLSHGDLDHFNGLVGLLDALPIGQVTRTPTFPDKNNPAIRHTLAEIERRGVPVRVAHDGERFVSGDVVLEVLHPPEVGPDGNENTRSMVLRVCHAGHAILLTGDLEGDGLARLVSRSPMPTPIIQAPHHGSNRVDAAALTRWAQPRLVVSSQGPPRGAGRAPALYTAGGARFWTTHHCGAITIQSDARRLSATAFLTGERFDLEESGR
jgi:competence protein ComEC